MYLAVLVPGTCPACPRGSGGGQRVADGEDAARAGPQSVSLHGGVKQLTINIRITVSQMKMKTRENDKSII